MSHHNRIPPDDAAVKSRKKVYICYPFGVDSFNTTERFQAVLRTLIHRGFTPITASCYLATTNFWSYDLMLAYSTIDGCDLVVLCYEERMTDMMIHELLYARKQKIPIARMVDIKKGDG
jgi:hypothetical protein